MEENKTNQEEPEKYNVLLTDEKQQAQEEQSEAQREETRKQLKKWLIFALMGLVFLGCMYLLFFMGNASEDKLKVEQDLIPEPAEISLPEDKGQAYEQDLLEQKRKEKQMAMQSLGDFSQSVPPEDDPINASMTSYQKVHRNLDDFYREDSDEEKKQMQEEIDQLKKQLTAPKTQDPLETQMKLMERSYQLANKYSLQQDKPEISDETSETKANDNA